VRVGRKRGREDGGSWFVSGLGASKYHPWLAVELGTLDYLFGGIISGFKAA